MPALAERAQPASSRIIQWIFSGLIILFAGLVNLMAWAVAIDGPGYLEKLKHGPYCEQRQVLPRDDRPGENDAIWLINESKRARSKQSENRFCPAVRDSVWLSQSYRNQVSYYIGGLSIVDGHQIFALLGTVQATGETWRFSLARAVISQLP
jgi:hypothetical protein